MDPRTEDRVRDHPVCPLCFGPKAVGLAKQLLGDDFYRLARLSKSSLEGFLGKDDERLEELLAAAEKIPGASSIRPINP